MGFALQTGKGSVKLLLDGSFDISSSTEAKAALDDAVSPDVKLLEVDGGGLTYLDSSGVAAILYARKLCQKSGTGFRVVSMSPEAFRVIELAKLTGVLGVVASSVSPSFSPPAAAMGSISPAYAAPAPSYGAVPPPNHSASIPAFDESDVLSFLGEPDKPASAAPSPAPAGKASDSASGSQGASGADVPPPVFKPGSFS